MKKNAKQCMFGTQQKKKIPESCQNASCRIPRKKLPYGTKMSFSQSRTEVLIP
jgi:hypothetical protein